MGYLFLALAILFSVLGNLFMKLSNGFKNRTATVLAVICYLIVALTLTFSIQYLEVGIAYAIWSGTTILFVALIGTIFLKESRSLVKYVALSLITAGVVLLQIAA
ncbi:ethidium bromide-methyl viologen resistance protein EmrE [Bacillus sp. JCM 19046]|nr:ethidium bromide-methyl viologen resistance protein EmrE [Bacillus sp. JCM 19045]GAF16961.1 ethidium bromide-methyl viologen resistance protein EmrE [Bacillus sp. JCM 19046]